MKKILALLLAVLLVFPLAGCGAKAKLEQKVGEKVAEKIVESATGNKVTIDGDKVTVKDKESGVEATFGGAEWPKNELTKSIPEFKKGKVVNVAQDKEAAFIMLMEVEKKDFENYREDIEKSFSENVFETNTDNTLAFGGEDTNGFTVMLTYDKASKTLSIVINKTE